MNGKNKLELVEKLKQTFSEKIFRSFIEFAYVSNTDVVKELLYTMQNELFGTFDYDALNVYKK